MTLNSDLTAVSADASTLATDHGDCIATLTTYVGQINAMIQLVWGGKATQTQLESDLIMMAATLTSYVQQFDKVTLDTSAVRSAVALAVADASSTAAAAAILPPSANITDSGGEVWSFGSPNVGADYPVMMNGAEFQGCVAMMIAVYGGNVWLLDSLNNWWTRDSTGKMVTSLFSPYGSGPANLRSFNTQDGATIVASAVNAYPNAGAFLVDQNAATWTFGAQAANGKDFVVMRNNIPFTEAGFTTTPYAAIMMRLKNGVVWLQDAAASWVYPPT